MKVYVFPNNIMMIFTIVSYLIDKIIRQDFVFPIEILFTVFGIILLCILKLYASGDMKAMISIFFALRFLTYPDPNLLLFLICILITNTFFSVTYIYRKIKKKILKEKNDAKDNRVAYFPYLTIGYILTNIICFIIL